MANWRHDANWCNGFRPCLWSLFDLLRIMIDFDIYDHVVAYFGDQARGYIPSWRLKLFAYNWKQQRIVRQLLFYFSSWYLLFTNASSSETNPMPLKKSFFSITIRNRSKCVQNSLYTIQLTCLANEFCRSVIFRLLSTSVFTLFCSCARHQTKY